MSFAHKRCNCHPTTLNTSFAFSPLTQVEVFLGVNIAVRIWIVTVTFVQVQALDPFMRIPLRTVLFCTSLWDLWEALWLIWGRYNIPVAVYMNHLFIICIIFVVPMQWHALVQYVSLSLGRSLSLKCCFCRRSFGIRHFFVYQILDSIYFIYFIRTILNTSVHLFGPLPLVLQISFPRQYMHEGWCTFWNTKKYNNTQTRWQFRIRFFHEIIRLRYIL